MKRLLVIVAHPSDESYLCAATIAKYVKAGWTVDLVTATLGEKGGDESVDAQSAPELGAQKQNELEKTGEFLGITSVTFLGYADGSLHTDPAGELEEQLYAKLVELVPDVVITYDTTGINNNPDNIRLCYSATFAFQKYAVWLEKELLKSPEFTESQAPKLYYATMPESAVEFLKRKKIFPEEAYGRPLVGTPDKFITTVISAAGVQTAKKKALRMYESLSESLGSFLSFQANPFLKQEYFVMRYHGTREVFMGKNDRILPKL